MKIYIIAVGNVKESYYKEGTAEYLKRISRFSDIEIIEVKEEKIPERAAKKECEQIKAREAESISRQIRSIRKANHASVVIALDVKGAALDSEKFAHRIGDYMSAGKSTLIFVIGGSLGLGDGFLGNVDLRFSMSALTFPHRLARLILAEQLFRAFKILAGETYHK